MTNSSAKLVLPLIILLFLIQTFASEAKVEKALFKGLALHEPEGKIPKGSPMIQPGDCINGRLEAGDPTYEDGTFVDEYILSWPGGGIEISLESGAFDEFLWIFRPSGSETQVDADAGTPTEVFSRSDAVPGIYTIWVNSYQPASGNYRLCVSQPTNPCSPGPAPTGPAPSDGAGGVLPDVNLSWNNPLKNKVLYGVDDRLDVYQVTDPNLLKAYDSTVVLVTPNEITNNGNGTFTLLNDPWVSEGGTPLCANERFRGQPNPGSCSGFLVGPDLVVTAGHCTGDAVSCGDSIFVFGFQMLDANTPVLTVPASDVYFCDEIVDRVQSDFTDEDWSLVRLDRPVVGHDPLPIRRSGKIPNAQSLVMIGYPVGLPAKIAGGANVRSNADPIFFKTNADSFEGNSGAAVFNANTLEVEGIMFRGDTDFVLDGDCMRSKQCPNDGCAGEDVTRITLLSELIPPAIEYDIYFGPCGNLQLLGTTEERSWPLSGLSDNTTYCWRIDAVNECSTTPGPVWSFSTGGGMNYDIVDDNLIDAKDLLALMELSMLGDSNLFGFAMNWKTMTTKRIVVPAP